MEVSGYLVDWNEATKRMAAGTLESTMTEAIDAEERWVEELEWCESHTIYIAMADAWEAERGAAGVPRDLDAKAQEFMNVLITFSGFCLDLKKESEVIAIRVSPETDNRLAKAVAGVDFRRYRAACFAKTPKHTQLELGECSESGALEDGFEEMCLGYIKIWVDGIKTAAKSSAACSFTLDKRTSEAWRTQ